MESNRQRSLRRFILAVDTLLILLSMMFAYLLHSHLRHTILFLRKPPLFEEYALLAFLTTPLFVGLIIGLRLDRCLEIISTSWKLGANLFKLHFFLLISLSVLLFVTQSVINRSIVGLFLICSFILLYLERILLTRWLKFQYQSGQSQEQIVVVGSINDQEWIHFVDNYPHDSYTPILVGYITQELTEGCPGKEISIPWLGSLDLLERILHEQTIDRVLFFSSLAQPQIAEAVRTCDRLGVTPGFAVGSFSRLVQPQLEWNGGWPFVCFEPIHRSPSSLAIKQAFDFFFSLLVLVLAMPLILAIILAIYFTMGRPIFFSQERAGIHGRKFRMHKFRTMVLDAEKQQTELRIHNEMSGPVFKIKNDPRITSLGKILRKSSMDELPQLWNVVRGQMSLIGPRPLPHDEQQNIHGWHRRRLSMKPGITGLWQVSGRNHLDFDQWMQLDLRYVDEWSLGLDFKILFRTVPAVFLGKGAQ